MTKTDKTPLSVDVDAVEINSPYDSIYISQKQWNKAMENAIPNIGTLFGSIKIIASKVMEDDQILLVSNNKIVAVVNLVQKPPLD
jgi:hypothetical protein